MCFNLIEREWIPVVRQDGTFARVGIRGALESAGEIREIRGLSPLDTVALYRFLIAVLQWCNSKPTDDDRQQVRRDNGFRSPWMQKVNEHTAMFDLLGETEGFYQDRSAWDEVLSSAKKKRKKPSRDEDEGGFRPAADLVPELPSGTNVAHFRHTRDRREGLCPACCAVGLVQLSAFATSVKHGSKLQKPAGINGPEPAYAFPMSDSLLETLLINWPAADHEGDRPGWASNLPPPRENIGAQAAFTWRPRRVWLERPARDQPPGVCAFCGSHEHTLIHRIAFLPGWQRPFDKGPWPDDPHLLVETREPRTKRGRPSQTAVGFPNMPRSDYVRARMWRGAYGAVLRCVCPTASRKEDHTQDQPGTEPQLRRHLRRCLTSESAHVPLTLGFFGPSANRALYQDAASFCWRLPACAITPDVAQLAVAELERLDRLNPADLLATVVPRSAKKRPEILAAQASAALHCERMLQEHFEEFIDKLVTEQPPSPEKAVSQWRESVESDLGDHLEAVFEAIRSGLPLRDLARQAMLRPLLKRQLADHEKKRKKAEAESRASADPPNHRNGAGLSAQQEQAR